ncbi:CDP-alcohol phosphatidyltransferase family protein [Varunaivibrio sulfuroxidans]|uniref:CDP-diacylglycerol--glycerol-3-phosphate 3-phosphatidyltransferase n=1 Tax=Varunaivibrio sulfuroxidans TaxID=1773489 RepID=A0A4R3J557_9PROT|nr:CDP-alcohol phosphatidyltransferase family protein [Varunaivibrio sulfuroxidans]TCS60374.1 cardiolipin synthase [Varunaivibrio sulfuroxidans]WES30938.1 CDP-alcohol phosphatidyltransferase family protein [Varunaivibrio sulfuroxidans]
MNLPNTISLLRLALVPLVVWLILENMIWESFGVFVLAGVSDALDGFIAKQFNMETELGKYLDPLADKALLVSVYVTLGQQGYLASWLVILVVFRDAMIVGGVILFQTLEQAMAMRPLLISKVNTTAQIVLAGVVLGGYGLSWDLHGFVDILAYIVGATTAVSGVVYVIRAFRHASGLDA